MTLIADLERYLEAEAFRRKQPGNGEEWGWAPFVTISREPGAGGHTLAQALLGEMARRGSPLFSGWKIFDQVLLKMLAESPRLKLSMKTLLGEEYHNHIQDYLHQVLTGALPQDYLLARVFHALRAMAGLGKVIVVGRAGACLTRDLSKGVHVRLVASEESRLGRLARRLRLPAAEARRRLRLMERERAALVREHFGCDVHDPLLYDCVWNTDAVSMETIARWIADAVQEKQGRPGELSAQPARRL